MDRWTAPRYYSWLEHFHGDQLARIDSARQDAGPEAFALFRELDADLWGLLAQPRERDRSGVAGGARTGGHAER